MEGKAEFHPREVGCCLLGPWRRPGLGWLQRKPRFPFYSLRTNQRVSLSEPGCIATGHADENSSVAIKALRVTLCGHQSRGLRGPWEEWGQGSRLMLVTGRFRERSEREQRCWWLSAPEPSLQLSPPPWIVSFLLPEEFEHHPHSKAPCDPILPGSTSGVSPAITL